ncbi:MAG: NifB/NifX family molybdenum-iron cluster-binding protein [Clostridium sp.]|uniref:NifB/NifX family molybdenum-iron cluster-binding protein n=1 Tax=Clostridium sp. TaxID=1506 RepID=UPI0039EAC8D2
MSYKVAIATSDGKFVNQHFGKATKFEIYEVEDKKFNLLEVRENSPACGDNGHQENAMYDSINLLLDCKIVLISMIGVGPDQVLFDKGILSYETSDSIENALQYVSSNIEGKYF